jgi:hypothetical protein
VNAVAAISPNVSFWPMAARWDDALKTDDDQRKASLGASRKLFTEGFLDVSHLPLDLAADFFDHNSLDCPNFFSVGAVHGGSLHFVASDKANCFSLSAAIAMLLIDELQRVIHQAVPTSREVPGPIAFLRLVSVNAMLASRV